MSTANSAAATSNRFFLHHIPRNTISQHSIDSLVAVFVYLAADRQQLTAYDVSRTRRHHIGLIRNFLNVHPFVRETKTVLAQAMTAAALTKDELSDIINVGIESLVKHRFELPAFSVLLREAKAQRAAAYKALFRTVHDSLSEAACVVIDALFLVEEGQHTSPWNDLKTDAPKATLDGLRALLLRYDQLSTLADKGQALEGIPEVKRQQLARIIDDLCNVFCKQMLKVQHLAEEELEEYLCVNQDKTDEIIRRFAQLDDVLKSEQSLAEQIVSINQLVSARQDLCEFSRVHAEYGGKNENRFMWRHFKARRTQLFRILTKLTFVATSQDQSFVRALAFVLANKNRHGAWLTLGGKGSAILTEHDLDWVPRNGGSWSREKPATKSFHTV